MRLERRIQGQTLRAIREAAADRPRCKHDGYLIDLKTCRCWMCGRANREAQRARRRFRAGEDT